MDNLKSSFRKIEILIAVASVVFGLVASSLLEAIISPLFNTQTRALLAGILSLAVLVIISLVALGMFARRNERINNHVQKELTNINQRLGLTVEFVHDPPNRSTGEVYRRAREIIERAEYEILVLHHVRQVRAEEQAPFTEAAEYREERQKYTEAILKKLQQNKSKRLFYRRIYQLPGGLETNITEQEIGKRLFDHANASLSILNEYQNAGYLKKAPVFLKQTYAIIDKRYVIWAIDGIDPEYDVQYMEGALIFDDPHQEFVQYLLGFFEKVDARSIIVQKLPEA